MFLSETSVPGTDDWCVMQLAAEFGDSLPRKRMLQSYVDGTQMLPVYDTSASMRSAYLRFVKTARLNLADLTIGARVSRMRPLGFRTAAPGDTTGDKLAMRNWRRSKMKVGSRDLFSDFATFGEGGLLTTGPTVPSADAKPLMRPLSPLEFASRQYTLEPYLTEMAMFVGYDDIAGVETLTLLRPGYMRQALRIAKRTSVPDNGKRWSPGRGWAWESDPIPLGYTDQVPFAHIEMKGGKGVFEGHTDSLDRINRGILDRLTITAMQAFRQRGIRGDLPKEYPADHPQAGQEINYDEIYSAGPAALWMLPVGAEVWESSVTDITPIITGNKDDVVKYAGATTTPLYILQPDVANTSAGAADLAREGIIFAVEEMNDRAELGLSIAHSLNFQAMGDTLRADPDEVETIWASVARLSMSEQAQAASIAPSGGLPQRMIDEKIWQLSPAEIEQAAQDRSDEAFESAITGA
jgi:hypothetical protein